jgi:uncharacterized membrane protein
MSKKHMALMLICCLIPIAAIIGIAIFAIPITSVVSIGIVLMCPLMMLFMMRSMHGHAEHTGHADAMDHQHAPAIDQK